MIDEILQKHIRTLASDAERRSVVQRCLALAGHTDPPEATACVWEGRANTVVFTWGPVSLAGSTLLPSSDIIEDAPGRFRRRTPAERRPRARDAADPLLRSITPAQAAAIRKAAEPIRAAIDRAVRPTLSALSPEERAEVLRAIRAAIDPATMSAADVRESVEALRVDVESLDLPEGL